MNGPKPRSCLHLSPPDDGAAPSLFLLGSGILDQYGVDTDSPRPPKPTEYFQEPYVSLFDEPAYQGLTRLLTWLQIPGDLQITQIMQRLRAVEASGVLHHFTEDTDSLGFAHFSASAVLKYYIKDVVSHCTRWLSDQTCPHIDAMVKHVVNKGDMIVNLNVDLVIEKSLEKLVDWSAMGGYGFLIDLQSQYKWEGRERIPKYDVALLKPWGSVNWHARLVQHGSALGTPATELSQKETYSLTVETADEWTRQAQGVDSSIERCKAFLEKLNDRPGNAVTRVLKTSQTGPYVMSPPPVVPGAHPHSQTLDWRPLLTHHVRSVRKIYACGLSFKERDLTDILRLTARADAIPRTINVVARSKEIATSAKQQFAEIENLTVKWIDGDLASLSSL